MLIKNGKIVTPAGTYEASIAIRDGRIIALSRSDDFSSGSVVDASGRYVLPGVIDPHLHLWSEGEGRSFEENCASEPKSMVCGGVTSILSYVRCAGSYLKVLPQLMKTIEDKSLLDIALSIVVNNQQHVTEIPVYAKEYGVASFKIYTAPKGVQLVPGAFGSDDGMLYDAFCEIKELGYPGIATIHAENWDIATSLTEKIRKENPKGDQVAYSDSRPNLIEEEAMRRAIFIASKRACPLYIVHISIAEGPDVIAEARSKGIEVYGETCAHYLALTKHDKHPDVPLKHMPPLRDRSDVESLWRGIQQGHIICVGSDHLTGRLKSRIWREPGNIWTAIAGFPASPTILPIMLSEGVSKGRISIEKVAEVCSYNPSRIFGLYPQKGALQVGSDADLVIVDMKKEVTMKPELLHTSSDYTWYDGRKFKGWPVMTIARGEIVMQEGEVLKATTKAHYLRRQLSKENPPTAVRRKPTREGL